LININTSLFFDKFKEIFLDKELKLYDWQINIIEDLSLKNKYLKLIDLDLDPA
jgi:hypothetical protein